MLLAFTIETQTIFLCPILAPHTIEFVVIMLNAKFCKDRQIICEICCEK